MYQLIIYSQRNGATLRTRETVTEGIKRLCEQQGIKIAARRHVSDRLVDTTYANTGSARSAAEAEGMETLTRQKVSALAALNLRF